jgi:hypothetical protein
VSPTPRELAEAGAALASILALVFVMLGLPLVQALAGAVGLAALACGLVGVAYWEADQEVEDDEAL